MYSVYTNGASIIYENHDIPDSRAQTAHTQIHEANAISIIFFRLLNFIKYLQLKIKG